jgi:hypothetical protein
MLGIEGVVNGGIGREKAQCGSGCLDVLHRSLMLLQHQIRVLDAIVVA